MTQRRRHVAALWGAVVVALSGCGGGDGSNGNGNGSGTGTPAPAGITWQVVDGPVQAMAPNTGYVATGPALTTFTLPPSSELKVGDVVRIHGVGSGGWVLNQHPDQKIVTTTLPGEPGLQWVVRSALGNARALAASADGMRLVAALNGTSPLMVSLDGGATWSPSGPSMGWSAVAVSPDGMRIAAVAFGQPLHLSTDGGATWNATATPSASWRGVAMSADGSRLVAVAYNLPVYISTDAGATWTQRETPREWRSIASSADGSRLIAATRVDRIHVSGDGGATWTAHGPAASWFSVAASADGSRLVAVGGAAYISHDGGATWAERDPGYFVSVASSADGRRLVAASNDVTNKLYTSVDGGLTWTARLDTGLQWHAVASSADGYRLAAASVGGPIYTLSMTTTPGTAGGLAGPEFSAVELQYLGDDSFGVLSSAGAVTPR